MRPSRDFFKPLAAGAPAPVQEIPFKPSRVIHFFPPQIEKMVAKLPETIPNVDILLGNLEDAIEYIDMANLALKAGLPAEASRMVEQAYSAGLLGKGSDAVNHQKLRQQIQQRLTEDIKALPALEKSAKDANALASLADVYASQQKWEQAQLNYSKAIAMGLLNP